MRNFLILLGRQIISFLYFIGGLSNLLFQSFRMAFIPPFKKERIFEQAKKTGVDSLPIVSLVALFIGIILALQTAVQMQRLGSEMYISSIVALSLVRELGPVITALIVAGRVGAAITAEIGSMKISEQQFRHRRLTDISCKSYKISGCPAFNSFSDHAAGIDIIRRYHRYIRRLAYLRI